MISIPALSGGECLRALRRAGFEVLLVEGHSAHIVRAGRALAVPLEACLPEERVRALLGEAGVSVTEFLELLSRSRSCAAMRAARAVHHG
jgi:hypothetical protein